MLDEILDMFGRKRSAAGAKPRGLGGMLTRVQAALEGDDDRHRSGSGGPYRDDRDHRDHDDPLDLDDRRDRHGRRRERDGFDLGDD